MRTPLAVTYFAHGVRVGPSAERVYSCSLAILWKEILYCALDPVTEHTEHVTSRDHPRQSSLPDSLGKCWAHSLPIGSASVAIVHVKLVIRISLNVSDPSSHQ